MKRVVAIVGLLSVALTAHLSATELPEVKELMVVGFGELVEGDFGKAREEAMLNALKEAVRVSLLEFIPSSTLEENAIALDMEIFSRVTQYVQTFKILSETAKADGHEVLLQARVALQKLRNSISEMGLLEEKVAEEEAVRVRLILAEVSRYPWYREFEDFLAQDLGFVRGVRLESVMTGEFTMEVELIGDIQSLLDALAEEEFEEFFLEINHDVEDHVMVLFRSRVLGYPHFLYE